MLALVCGAAAGALGVMWADTNRWWRFRDWVLPGSVRPLAEKLFQEEINEGLVSGVNQFRLRIDETTGTFVAEAIQCGGTPNLLQASREQLRRSVNDVVVESCGAFRHKTDNAVRSYLERTIADNAQLPVHQSRRALLIDPYTADPRPMAEKIGLRVDERQKGLALSFGPRLQPPLHDPPGGCGCEGDDAGEASRQEGMPVKLSDYDQLRNK